MTKHAATPTVSAECPPCISWPRTLRVVSLFDVAVLQIRVAFKVADAVVQAVAQPSPEPVVLGGRPVLVALAISMS